MIEIIRGRMGHAEAFHERPGGLVGQDGEGDDLVELENFETKTQSSAGRLGGVAAALEFVADAPADFDAGGEVRLEGGDGEADEAEEFATGGELDSPVAKVVLGEMI